MIILQETYQAPFHRIEKPFFEFLNNTGGEPIRFLIPGQFKKGQR